PFRIVRGIRREDADAPHRAGLLRTRRERPRRCRAHEREERAAFHCSMPPGASDRKDSTPQYGRRLLRCGIWTPLMTAGGDFCQIDTLPTLSESALLRSLPTLAPQQVDAECTHAQQAGRRSYLDFRLVGLGLIH